LIAAAWLQAADAVVPGVTVTTNKNSAKHWAFIPPTLPPVPSVRNTRWVRNTIDAFVLARLEKEGLTPSPEADRRTLIRRLSLDLLGLPPSPERVQAFLADTRPDAYERLVDSFLDSPHFGERWARHWLDLARYADTSGYQIDRPRPFAYLFRDWVIDAINNDMPFDQFTVEQIAGDLLPNATIDQKIAAGFHRLTLMNHEDGVDAQEFRCKAKVDRVSTTGTVWLGLTFGCAECHNHKYDPITQREFYQLYAFFNNCDEADVLLPQENDTTRIQRTHKDWEREQVRLKEMVVELARTDDPRVEDVKGLLAQHRRKEPKTIEAQAMTFQERTNSARARIHVRGDFLRQGDEVCASTPAILNPLKPRCSKADRLDLARWLVSPENPLTARVAVNHVWLHLFGRGLVASTEDFGTRGERPSHSELLDWLAVSFVTSVKSLNRSTVESPAARPASPAFNDLTIQRFNGINGLAWHRKALIRLIVTSATYRQTSHFRPALMQRDPMNVLLARQNRFRLESETIRDLCLATSGLLNDDIGGPSFRPYMSEDVKKLGTAGAFTWIDTEGPETYRRGLYIFAQRTVPYPTAMTFDQAEPTQSCTRRERSNTPLQALTLLNHGLFVECARALARRIAASPPKEPWRQASGLPVKRHPAARLGSRLTGSQGWLPRHPEEDPRARLEQAFELCLARLATRAELERLEKLYQEQLTVARENLAASAKFCGLDATNANVAEMAAFTGVSQVLLNLDEFMTRE
jgi:hypothetical protein